MVSYSLSKPNCERIKNPDDYDKYIIVNCFINFQGTNAGPSSCWATEEALKNPLILREIFSPFPSEFLLKSVIGLANSWAFLLLEISSNFIGQAILNFRQRLTWFSASDSCGGSQVLQNQECFDPWAVKQPKFQQSPFAEISEKVWSQTLTPKKLLQALCFEFPHGFMIFSMQYS